MRQIAVVIWSDLAPIRQMTQQSVCNTVKVQKRSQSQWQAVSESKRVSTCKPAHFNDIWLLFSGQMWVQGTTGELPCLICELSQIKVIHPGPEMFNPPPPQKKHNYINNNIQINNNKSNNKNHLPSSTHYSIGWQCLHCKWMTEVTGMCVCMNCVDTVNQSYRSLANWGTRQQQQHNN